MNETSSRAEDPSPACEELPLAPAMGTATLLTANPAQAEANSRPLGLRFALMTLRLLERWRTHLGVDLDAALIVLATVAITMEKFTRLDFEAALRDINSAMPADQLTRCNISSIASATGMNRETARRKVAALVDARILLRDANGSIRLNPDFTRKVTTGVMLSSQLQTLVHVANDLLRDGILESEPAGDVWRARSSCRG